MQLIMVYVSFISTSSDLATVNILSIAINVRCIKINLIQNVQPLVRLLFYPAIL